MVGTATPLNQAPEITQLIVSNFFMFVKYAATHMDMQVFVFLMVISLESTLQK